VQLGQAFLRFAVGVVVGVTVAFGLPLAVHGCAPADVVVPVTEPEEFHPVPKRAQGSLAPLNCPEGMALVDEAFCIDRWEASLVEMTPKGERPYSPYATVSGTSVRAVSQAGVFPQAYVSRVDAENACAAAQKRLCTAQEWVYACKGGGAQKFPYGSVRRTDSCNDAARVSPLKSLFGHMGGRMFGYRPMNDPRLNQVPGTLAKSGAYSECTNRYGVFDMVGNLHEWVDDPDGTFRGGYYMDTTKNGDGCTYDTTAHDFTYHDYSTGFRCCADEGSLPSDN
jgi:hypothetical protein